MKMKKPTNCKFIESMYDMMNYLGKMEKGSKDKALKAKYKEQYTLVRDMAQIYRITCYNFPQTHTEEYLMILKNKIGEQENLVDEGLQKLSIDNTDNSDLMEARIRLDTYYEILNTYVLAI